MADFRNCILKSFSSLSLLYSSNLLSVKIKLLNFYRPLVIKDYYKLLVKSYIIK